MKARLVLVLGNGADYLIPYL